MASSPDGLRRPLSAASSARYSVKVNETKLVVRTIVPSRLTDISPSSQKHRDALVGVSGVPRPRTKHELFGCRFNRHHTNEYQFHRQPASALAYCSGGCCSPCMAAHGSAACRRGICLNHQVLASQSRACTLAVSIADMVAICIGPEGVGR